MATADITPATDPAPPIPIVVSPDRTYRFEEHHEGRRITITAICNETGGMAQETIRANAVSSNMAQIHTCLVRRLEQTA